MTSTLVLSQGSFYPELRPLDAGRVPPAPTVLYRDPERPTLTHLGRRRPRCRCPTRPTASPAPPWSPCERDALGYFAARVADPSTATPDQAVLSVVLDAQVPQHPNDPSGLGPLPRRPDAAARPPCSPSPPPGAAPGRRHHERRRRQHGQGHNDDGLFDAIYSFVVPADADVGHPHHRRRLLHRDRVHPLHRRDGQHHRSTSPPRPDHGRELPRRPSGAAQTQATLGRGAAAADRTSAAPGPRRRVPSTGSRRLPDLAGRACCSSSWPAASSWSSAALARRRRAPVAGRRGYVRSGHDVCRPVSARRSPQPVEPPLDDAPPDRTQPPARYRGGRRSPIPSSTSSARSRSPAGARCPTAGSSKSSSASWSCTAATPRTPTRSSWPSGRPTAPAPRFPQDLPLLSLGPPPVHRGRAPARRHQRRRLSGRGVGSDWDASSAWLAKPTPPTGPRPSSCAPGPGPGPRRALRGGAPAASTSGSSTRTSTR